MEVQSKSVPFRILVGGARKTWTATLEGLSNIADESALYFQTERRAEFQKAIEEGQQGCVMYPKGHIAFDLSQATDILADEILAALKGAHSDVTRMRVVRSKGGHKPFGVAEAMHLN